MATKIVTKSGSGAPATTDLVAGELAVDLTNKRLYTENDSAAIIELGTNPSGDITFGDNGKAIFGAGSDLQIYHNATSNIIDSSAATLAIQAPQFVVQDDTGTKNLIWVTQPSSSVFDVRLSYDGSTKLATTATGIDVTGSVTADGLTVDGPASFDTNDAANPVVISRFGSANESLSISINDSMTSFVSEQDETGTTRYGGFEFIGRHAGTNRTRLKIDHTTGDVSFYEDTGTTPKFFWDASAESLGIGTSTPSAVCDITGSPVATGDARYELIVDENKALATGRGGGLAFARQGVIYGGIKNIASGFSDDNTDMHFQTRLAGTVANKMVIKSSGSVGIGTDDVTDKLTINADAGDGITFDGISASAAAEQDVSEIKFINRRSSGTTIKANIKHITNGNANGSALTFGTTTGAGATEAMRIDASGSLLVGKTATGLNNAGAELRSDGSNYFTRDGGLAGYFNRLTSDGDIVTFRKDNATVGSIGTQSGDLGIGTGTCGIRFNDGVNAVIPFNTTTNAQVDNTLDLGYATFRWNDAYITNGVTTGSDRNQKQDIETLSDAEQRVAVACKGLLRKWRWIDAVEAKGDDARIHFGIIAQDLQAAFEAEGLDAGRYAMFMSNTWVDEETGEERTRLGVRYHELLAFIIAAI